MDERQMVCVTLFDADENTTSKSVPEAVEWLTGLLEQIPDEYRENSTFLVGIERGCYTSADSLDFRVYYDRPETDEELARRLENERVREEADRRKREAHERCEFERLRAKYGA